MHAGSALNIPFADNLFDAVWMQNVGMNIPDKPKLYQEITRVLKPGSRFDFQEMVAGETPTTYFPLPWATDGADNFLISASEMHTMLTRSGFRELYFEDVSEAPLPAPPNGTAEDATQTPLSLSVYVENLAQKAENASRSLRERHIRLHRGVFRAK